MSKHTPGTWQAINWTYHSTSTVVVDDPSVVTGKRVIAECDTEDDARRIVACVNACEGIDTEYLEGDESLPHYARRLMTQRDELLAELERERESRKTAQMRLHDEYERRSKTGLQHNMEKSRLMRQCDELLAALKVAISRQAYRPGEGPDWWEKGCAVIAKVEGGQYDLSH